MIIRIWEWQVVDEKFRISIKWLPENNDPGGRSAGEVGVEREIIFIWNHELSTVDKKRARQRQAIFGNNGLS